MRALKAAIKQLRWYPHIHVVRRAGLRHWMRRETISRHIDQISPRRTRHWRPGTNDSPVEIHMLVRRQDVRMALWSLASFYRVSAVDWPIVFHQGGYMTRSDWARLKEKFPTATILTSHYIRPTVEAELARRGMSRILAVRGKGGTYQKLIDPLLLSSAKTLMILDTDILFFERPNEILNIAGRPDHLNTYNRDAIALPYTLSQTEAIQRFGRPLATYLNSGLALLNRTTVPLERVEEYSADPLVCSNQHFIEQTILALLASEFGHDLLPDTYVCSKARGLHTSDGRPLIAKHYIETPRPLLFEEGMIELLQRGFC